MPIIKGSIQIAKATLAQWTNWNGVLLDGQLCIVSDAASDAVKIKEGDGVTTWNSLPYFNPASSSQTLAQTLSLGNTTGGNNPVLSDNDALFIGSDETRYIYHSTMMLPFGLIIGNDNSGEYISLVDSGGIDFGGTVLSILEISTLSGITSNIQTQLNSKYASFSLNAGYTNTSLADSVIYYYGNAIPTNGANTTVNQRVGGVPFPCTLIGAIINTTTLVTLASPENTTVSIRINNTTDVVLSSTVKFNATNTQSRVSNLNTAFADTDTWEIKMTTPPFATNPVVTAASVTLIFKYTPF